MTTLACCSINDRDAMAHIDGARNIAIGKLQFRQLECMLPEAAWVYGHKARRGDTRFAKYAHVTTDQYIKWYIAKLNANAAAIDVWLRSIRAWEVREGREACVALVCFCPLGQEFCHRYVVADWLRLRYADDSKLRVVKR